jgi:heme exporter protein B
MTGALVAIAGQTARLSFRAGGGAFVGLVFYLAVVVAIPFAVGPDLKLLARIGPAILFVAALLATLLNLDRLFRDDHDDGALDLLLLADLPAELTVLAKCTGAWVATALPLVVATPVLGLLLAIDPAPLAAATAVLLVGTPALTLIGAIGAALATAVNRAGILVAVLVLPFTVPVIIFGVSAAAAPNLTQGLPPFLILVALTLVSAVIAPIAGAAALRAQAT